MACKNRVESNRFNFLRWTKVENATLSNLPITDLCPLFEPSNGLEPETIIWINGMSSPSQFQIEAIDKYIKSEKTLQMGQSQSNQSLKDIEFVSAGLSFSNSMVGSDGTTTLQGFGGLAKDAFGWIFNGTDSYINVPINLNSLTNYGLINAFVGGFIRTDTTGQVGSSSFGVVDSTGGNPIGVQIFETGLTQMGWRLNSDYGGGAPAQINLNNTTQYLSKVTGNNVSIYLGGLIYQDNGTDIGSIPTLNLSLGALNFGGSVLNYRAYSRGSFLLGAANGFNFNWHDQNKTILIAELASGLVMADYTTAEIWLNSN